MERSDIVAQRINFLRKIKCFREEGRDIVYTDETYVNAGHTVSKCWQTNQMGLLLPFNKGERMILLHAGSKNGFISGAKLVFKAKSTTGDYHSEMNIELQEMASRKTSTIYSQILLLSWIMQPITMSSKTSAQQLHLERLLYKNGYPGTAFLTPQTCLRLNFSNCAKEIRLHQCM